MTASRRLRISEDLSLPGIEAVTQTFVVYGGKGKGKTNFGSVLCEELAKARLRFCVTDPLDVWWGLQHGRTKDESGIDVVILGGRRGDIPIEPTAGAVVADFVADENVNTVIVMRRSTGEMWTAGERIRFMKDFAKRLFARQGEQREPLMLVIDEAGRFVPQNLPKGGLDIAECVGAIEELVEWGRNVGIGVCLITQRSARMNKSVSELAGCMVAFQTAGPNSIGAIVDWFGEHIDKERQKELVAALRKLPTGRALIVSPEWLDFEGEVQIRLRETFDSSATPKGGGALRAPGAARKPDLEKYRVRMAETIERAQAEDPRELRKKLAAAQAELKKAQAAKPAPAASATAPPKVERVEVPVLKEAQVKRLEAVSERMATVGGQLADVARELAAAVSNGHKAATAAALRLATPAPAPVTRPAAAAPASAPRRERVPREGGGARLGGGVARRMLVALAQFGALRSRRLALLAGVKLGGSTWRGGLAELRAQAWIEEEGDSKWITDAGREALGSYDPLPTGDQLIQYWRSQLGRADSANVRSFDAILAVYPNALTQADLAKDTGIEAGGSTMRGALAKLRGLELIGRTELRASDELFQE